MGKGGLGQGMEPTDTKGRQWAYPGGGHSHVGHRRAAQGGKRGEPMVSDWWYHSPSRGDSGFTAHPLLSISVL